MFNVTVHPSAASSSPASNSGCDETEVMVRVEASHDVYNGSIYEHVQSAGGRNAGDSPV